MVYKSGVRLSVAVLLALMVLVPSMGTASAAPPLERLIVVLHDSESRPEIVAEELSRRHNGRVVHVYKHALKGFSIALPAPAVAALSRDSRVDFVEQDQLAWISGEVPTGVDRIEAEKNDTAGIGSGTSVSVDVAIIDTGVASHSDLNVYRTIDCTQGNPVRAKCGSGGSDDNGHGTHVAGTVAARDNGSGVVGVAPGARIWGVKVLGADGSGYISWIVAGIDYVTSNASAIEVANMSLGCQCSSAAMDTAIANSTAAGVVYVVAAGNDNMDAAAFSPANHPNVIAVSAVADFDGLPGGLGSPTCRTDVDDTLADFSNFGPVVDIAAPGVCITSTWLNGGYATISGTSMASPHGAGAAALYIVEKGISKSDTRWSTVRSGLRTDWAVSQDDACGFSGGKSSEPFLMVGLCGSADPVENVAPTATFTPDCVDLTCAFDGSGSNDSDGSIVSYDWMFGDTTTGVGATPSHTYTSAGTYTVTLTVTDDDGETGSTSQSVTVSAPDTGNVSPTAVFTANCTDLGCNFDGSDSSDSDGTIDTYIWDFGDSSAPGSGITESHTYASDGTYTVTLTITDNGGATGSVSQSVTVSAQSASTTMHVESLSASSASTGNSWTAFVTITIHDADGSPVQNATVSGAWSNGTSGSGSCTTNISGQCAVSKSGIHKRVGSVTFTVNDVDHASLAYDAADNSVTSITVGKP